MKKKVCPKCGVENELTRYFCESCGAFLEGKEYDTSLYEFPQMKVMRIVDNLRHMSAGQPVPDEAFEPYAEKMERLQAIFSLPEFVHNKRLAEDMEEFLDICRHPDFQIAFVGTIKTGKSTLINALLGKNYASMAVTPETAALTKFRVSPQDYVHVVFYSEEEWEELWASRHNADKFMEEYNALDAESKKSEWVGHIPLHKNLTSDEVETELTKWSSSKSAEHYFVKEIEVGISTLAKDFPAQVVFVDTPGLFDPVSYRSELTKKYIRQANAVFVCVDAQKVQKDEIALISTVLSLSSNDREKVYIVATHWDKLNNPEEDWKEQKEWMIRQLTGKGFFATSAIARANIMHTAAYIHNLCRDYETLDEIEIRSLKKFALDYDYDVNDEEDRDKMVEKANIHSVFSIIRDTLAGQYRKYLMEDVEHRFIGIQHDLQRIAYDTKEDAHEFLLSSQEDFEEFQRRAEAKRRDYEKIQKVSEQLNKIIDHIEENTAQQMEKTCGLLRSKANPAYHAPQEKSQKGRLRSLARKFLGAHKQ
ncbi:dynamin family protein [Megasphaera hexanoica]|nr:dynamin family protein [Megasphaera hexanoica]